MPFIMYFVEGIRNYTDCSQYNKRLALSQNDGCKKTYASLMVTGLVFEMLVLTVLLLP